MSQHYSIKDKWWKFKRAKGYTQNDVTWLNGVTKRFVNVVYWFKKGFGYDLPFLNIYLFRVAAGY